MPPTSGAGALAMELRLRNDWPNTNCFSDFPADGSEINGHARLFPQEGETRATIRLEE
jgi:hypothetical protein